MIIKPKIVIAGGSGFLGSYLINFFKKDYTVVVLTRGDARSDNEVLYVTWDGKNQGDWINEIEGAEVLINLSGKSINCKLQKRTRRA